MNLNNQRISYRPDVDGLRALAVIAVVIFHVTPQLLPGGFIGVDIFFVISGYLITSIIIKNLSTNQFSILDFFIKRAIRIFPSLSLVLITTWLLGWWLLLPHEFSQLGKHMVGGAGFFANIIFARETGYFDSSAELKPLLHLWSLGVEEQYYIIWPFMMIILWKVRKHLFGFLGILLVSSLILNLVQIKTSPENTFYLLPTRFWELLLGAMLAIDDGKDKKFSQRFLSPNLRSILGLIMCLFPIFNLNKETLYPGIWAILPTFGALLLISSKSSWLNLNFLSSKAAVFIGLISYPLYLWHWPFLAFTEIVYSAENTMMARIGAALVSIFLAIITFKYFEKKLKEWSSTSAKAAQYLALTSTLIIFSIGVIGHLTYREIIKTSNDSNSEQIISKAIQEWDYPGRLKVHKTTTKLKYYSSGISPQFLFIGDSHMEQYYPRVESFWNEHPNKDSGYYFVTRGGCPPVPSIHEPIRHSNCPNYLELAMSLAKESNVKTIIISAAWTSYFKVDSGYFFKSLPIPQRSKGYELAMLSLKEMLTHFKAQGKKVFLILPSPTGAEFNPMMMVKREFSTNPIKVIMKPFSLKSFLQSNLTLINDLTSIAKGSDAIVLNPISNVCPDQLEFCETAVNGIPKYKDQNHLRPSYVKLHGDFIDQVFN